MQTRKSLLTVTGLTLLTFLLSGCYTRFGMVDRSYADDEIVYEDDYYEDAAPPAVVHYYPVPRYFSTAYFYYDPYDYWYWEPDVTVSFGFYYGPRHVYVYHSPYWYPPYGVCPPPYVYGGWYYPPRVWHYPAPYVVYTPPQSSPNFGRRPKYIAGRTRLPVESGDDPVYTSRGGSGKRTFSSLPKDESGTYGRRSDDTNRRRTANATDEPVYRRPTNRSSSATSVAKPSETATRRVISTRPVTRSTGSDGGSSSKAVSGTSNNRSSGSSTGSTVTRRSSGSGGGSYSKPASGSTGSSSGSSSGSSTRSTVTRRSSGSSGGSYSKPASGSTGSSSRGSSGSSARSTVTRRSSGSSGGSVSKPSSGSTGSSSKSSSGSSGRGSRR